MWRTALGDITKRCPQPPPPQKSLAEIRLETFTSRPVNRNHKLFAGLVIFVEMLYGDDTFFERLNKIKNHGGETVNEPTDPRITHFVLNIPPEHEPGRALTAREVSGRKKWQQLAREHAKYWHCVLLAPDAKRNAGRTRTVVRMEWLDAVYAGTVKPGQGDTDGEWGVWLRSGMDGDEEKLVVREPMPVGKPIIKVATDPRLRKVPPTSMFTSTSGSRSPPDTASCFLTPAPSAAGLEADLRSVSMTPPMSASLLSESAFLTTQMTPPMSASPPMARYDLVTLPVSVINRDLPGLYTHVHSSIVSITPSALGKASSQAERPTRATSPARRDFLFTDEKTSRAPSRSTSSSFTVGGSGNPLDTMPTGSRISPYSHDQGSADAPRLPTPGLGPSTTRPHRTPFPARAVSYSPIKRARDTDDEVSRPITKRRAVSHTITLRRTSSGSRSRTESPMTPLPSEDEDAAMSEVDSESKSESESDSEDEESALPLAFLRLKQKRKQKKPVSLSMAETSLGGELVTVRPPAERAKVVLEPIRLPLGSLFEGSFFADRCSLLEKAEPGSFMETYYRRRQEEEADMV